MENKLVLNNANIVNGNIDETNINRLKISYKMTSFGPAIFDKVAEAGKNLFRYLNIFSLSKEPYLMVLSSKFHYLGIVIKTIVFLIFLFIYFIIGATAVILYVIFYEKLYEMLFNKDGKKKHKSPYYYNWKNHHLALNWEE